MTDLVLAAGRLLPGLPGDRGARAAAAGGVIVDAGGAYVFRHEPSGDPARLQMFHQREIVRIGEPETVAAWRDAWRDRAVELLRGARARRRRRRRRRPVLRPQRPDARREPARAGAQVRDRWSTIAGAGADRGRVVQLPPGPLRRRSTGSSSPTAASRTPPASASGWSGSRSRCFRAHGLDLDGLAGRGARGAVADEHATAGDGQPLRPRPGDLPRRTPLHAGERTYPETNCYTRHHHRAAARARRRAAGGDGLHSCGWTSRATSGRSSSRRPRTSSGSSASTSTRCSRTGRCRADRRAARAPGGR